MGARLPGARLGVGRAASLRRSLVALAAGLAAAPAMGDTVPGTTEPAGAPLAGLVVVEAHETGVGAEAGLRPGDRLLAWSSMGSETPEEPLDHVGRWLWLEAVTSPTGTVRLLAERDGSPFEVELPPGRWGLSVRPKLEGEDEETATLVSALARDPPHAEALETAGASHRLAALIEVAASREDGPFLWWLHVRQGEHHFASRRTGEAEESWRRATAVAERHALPWLRLRALEQVAAAADEQGRREEAEGLLRELVTFAEATWGPSLPLARASAALAFHLGQRERLEEAVEHFELALELRERLAPDSLEVAATLDRLGILARRQGRIDQALATHQRALKLRQALDPRGRATVVTFNSLGLVAWRQGDLEGADAWLQQALEHNRATGSDPRLMISVVSNLGLVARERGDLAVAERYLKEAVTLEEAHGPETPGRSLATTLNSLGMVAADRGDLTGASDYYARALAILEEVDPGGRLPVMIEENLGLVALDQGELDDAERSLRRSLAFRESQDPDSMGLAWTSNNLGKLFLARGELEEAERFYRRSLEIKERSVPGSMTTANTLASLGHIARRRGDLVAAEALYQRTLEIRRQLGPGGLFEASALADLGSLATERGDLEEAGELLFAAREIVARLAPGSAHEASILRSLGELQRAHGEPEAAAHTLAQALDALEAQVGRLPGGDGTRARYRARHLGLYRATVEVLLELGRSADAFQVLERSRARMLLDMLAERDMLFSADIPPELAEAQLRLRRQIDRQQEELAALDPQKDGEAVARLQEELGLSLRRREELAETVRRSSPRLDALRYPRPVSAAGAQALLDPGTLLLSWSVSPSGTDVFALTRESLRVVRLPVGEEELRQEVERFRRLIQRGRLEPQTSEVLVTQGERLWDLLLSPIETELARSTQLLISPDGPLHLLPFAALVRSRAEGAEAGIEPGFLASSHAVAVSLSASLLEELRTDRSRPAANDAPSSLVAFGDPLGPGSGGTSGPAPVGTLVPRHAITPLPGSRAEVKALAERFGSTARVFLGPEATEARARSEGDGARYLHFATHGLLNELFPLSSGLVLAPGEGHNGLLQAWEIFEELRLEADLVTLSACETALGPEVRGEGLVGLTRAFQYAGARAVLASLWRVADPSTATLMDHFYQGIEAGVPTARALSEAQRRMLARESTAHPYHWAGFALYGDWR